MKRMIAAMAVLALWAGGAAAQDAEDGTFEARKAKAYVAEVRKHLLESYIERERVTRDALGREAVRGLEAGLADQAVGRWGEEDRAALQEALKGAEAPEGALDAARSVARERGLKIDWLRWADHAARAMAKASGDPYARILTKEEFMKLAQMMQEGQREDSLGIMIQRVHDRYVVAYVQYGYVGYEEGVEMGDEVLELNGEPVADRSPEALNEALRVKAGQEVRLKVRREGHERPYEFRLKQLGRKTKDVYSAMLGDGIGYVRITMFDLSLAGEVKRALKGLKEQGMKALILDLRHNPGGALPAATAVADLFLPQGLLITKTDMYYKPAIFGFQIPGLGGDQDYKTKVKSEFESMPLAILVNHASASASELLAGALQDHKRGRVVGETTYGKGVGQSPIPLTSTGSALLPERFLYLTVLRYYLPTGRSIDHKGVVPDLAYAQQRPSSRDFAELWRIRQSGALRKYLDDRWEEHKDSFAALAEYDGFATASYPDFEELYAALKTPLKEDAVREELRRAVRKRLTAEGGRFVHDLQTDAQLQYALVEMLDARAK